MFDKKTLYKKPMALSLLECTEMLKIVNTSFGKLPRSGLLEQPHELGLVIPLRSIASRLCGTLRGK